MAAYERLYGDLGPGQQNRAAAVIAWLVAQNPKLKLEDAYEMVIDRRKPAQTIEEQERALFGGEYGSGDD